jgi:putative molybdopterin biosynthesis protein
MVGVSRQTIYAMEAASYVPNTAVALKLAHALEVAVEDLFALPETVPTRPLSTEQVALLPAPEEPLPGQPVQLCRIERRLIASAPSPMPWYFPMSDGILSGPARRGAVKVQVFEPDTDFGNRLLVGGCDPGISVLARHAQAAGIELVLAHRNSSQALQLLKEGCLHIAGTHLRDEPSGESNLPAISRMFPKRQIAVVSFAVWEEGIVTARGNPKSIRGIEDLARAGVSIVNRESGSGSRALLDAHLKRLGISVRGVRGYEREIHGHLPAAWHVQTGAADCCIATAGAARLFGLDFIPLVSERYDLAIRRERLETPAVQHLLDILSLSRFRRELEGLGGYDTSATGQRML